jgi:hypothetical protein
MDCTQLFNSIGFRCRILPAVDGKPIHCITTPFRYFDGDGVHLYAENLGRFMRFFDSGDTMFHLYGSGIKFRSKRSIKPLQKLVTSAGAEMSDDGEISALVPLEDGQDGFRRAMAAVLSVTHWEADNAGFSSDIVNLAAEVEIYLREWKLGHEVLIDQPLVGISGRPHKFAFMIDGELIDVVSSVPQSTAAEVRRLADVRGIRSQSDVPILVVIDDRPNPVRAKQEAMILSRFADVMLLTALQEKVRAGASQH